MAGQLGVWGIELGQCALKAIRLEVVEGQVTATAYDYIEHPKILSQPDADPDQLTREALEKLLSRNTLRGDMVVIGVPGQSGLARFVKLPPVEEKKIGDIVRFEAKQQIPFNLEEVVWDYQKIGSGTVTEDGFAMETEIGLFAMKRDMVARYLQHFQDVGVEVHVVQMAPLALCNFLATDLLGKAAGAEAGADHEEKKCVVALDIGTDSSNLVVTDGERIIWQRPIPQGGNHFTRALTKDLKLTFAKAEHLKRNATKSPDLKKILTALRPVLNDFVGEVQRSLGYFTNTHRDAQIEYMVGLGNAFRLPGLQRFLGEKLSLEVRKLGKMERMTGDAVVGQQIFTENILTFPVAYGLALQGLGQTRLTTNLLPPEIRTERLVRAKKPFAVAAAACLLLGTAALGLSYALEYRTYNDSRVQTAIESSGGVVKQVQAAQQKYDKTKADAIAQEEAVKSIIAGQMERTHWPELYKFISNAVPAPDGSNLPPSGKQYWSTQPNPAKHPRPQEAMTGERAYQEWLRRVKSASSGEGAEGLGRGIDDLVQINLEGVSTAFCDNLGGYWKEVQADIHDDRGWVRPESDFDKPPQGRGWIVEVRGYTYHHGHDLFVLNTFVENLARLAGPFKDTEATRPSGPSSLPTPPPAPRGPGGAAAPEEAPKPAREARPEDLPDIVGHISHVVLLTSQFTPGEESPDFSLVGETKVVSMARDAGGGEARPGMGAPPTGGGPPGGMPAMPPGGGPPGGGPPGGGPPGGMPGTSGPPGGTGPGMLGGGAPSRDSWDSLSTVPGAAGGKKAGGGMMGGMGGGPPMGIRPPRRTPRKKTAQPMGPTAPGMNGQQGAASEPRALRGKPVRGYTEFVVLFIWKEETPSDGLRGQEAGLDSLLPGLPGLPGRMPGMPGGMPGMPGGMPGMPPAGGKTGPPG